MNTYKSFKSEQLSALLYDWHNQIKLRRQNDDIPFWKDFIGQNNMNVLVLGAGTGRIAIPLAGTFNTIFALDKCYERLARIRMKQETDIIHLIHADFIYPYMESAMDIIISPYSTFQLVPPQLLPQVLAAAFDALKKGGKLGIDVSDNFQKRLDTPSELAVDSYCDEIHSCVQEYQQTVKKDDSVELTKSYYVNEELILEEIEVWYLHQPDKMLDAITLSGFQLLEIRDGYGYGSSPHRHIYIVKR